MNHFLNLLDVARQNRWCTRPSCTTCGAADFRTSLRQLGGPDRAELANALADLDLTTLEEAPGWDDGLRLALDELQSHQLKDRVLTTWLPKLDQHVRLADLVLFYYVRRGALFAHMSIEVLQQWLTKCLDLASQTRDESLIESLVYTLGARYREHPVLNALVHELARGSRRVSLAVERQERGP